MELKGLEILQPSIVCMNKMHLHSYKFTPVFFSKKWQILASNIKKKRVLFFFCKASFECRYLSIYLIFITRRAYVMAGFCLFVCQNWNEVSFIILDKYTINLYH